MSLSPVPVRKISEVWIVSEASKCNIYPGGSCQKGPVAHSGAAASPHQKGRGLQLLTGLQGNLGIMLGVRSRTCPLGYFMTTGNRPHSLTTLLPQTTLMVESKVDPHFPGER